MSVRASSPSASRVAAWAPIGLAIVSAAAFVSGCKSDPPPPPPAPPPAAPVTPPPPPPPPPPPASTSGKSQPDCIAPFSTEGAPTTLKFGARTATKAGTVLTFDAPDADDAVSFGVIANLKEATGENILNMKKFLAFFTEQKVEAIVVAGDSGELNDGIQQVLQPLAASGLPVFVIPGNREDRAQYRAAMTALATTAPNIVDLSQVRLVKFDDVSFVSLPGYYDKRFIHVGDAGCQYFKEDVDALKPIIDAAAQPVVLVAHAEPYGSGPDSIDFFGDGNAGDSNLTALLKEGKVPFGVFSNIQEAGGRANAADAKPVAEGTPSDRLYVNPGLADSTPWKLNDGGWSYGMAATVTVQGGKASFKSLRVAQLTEAEREQARKLEAAAPAPGAGK